MWRLDEAKGQGDLMENIRALDRASLRANLWLTNDAITKIISGRRKILSVLLHVIDSRTSERDADELVEGFTEVSESISNGLGNNIMEDQIRKLAKSVSNQHE